MARRALREPKLVPAWPAGRAEILYERFKGRIIAQDWPPDQGLNIDRLAAEYGVSITPVREALARLVSDRLVVASQHRGFRVAPLPSAARFEEFCTVRLLMEPFAAGGAASRARPSDIRVLRRLHDQIATIEPTAGLSAALAYSELNREFHQQIFTVNGNTVLAELYAKLEYHVVIAHVHHSTGIRDLGEVVSEHAAIVDALDARDHDAAQRAMHVHVAAGHQRIAKAYGGLLAAPPGRAATGNPA